MRRKVEAILRNHLRSGDLGFFYRSFKNYLLTYGSIVAHRPFSGPTLAVISPTFRCNLKCRMCEFWKRPSGKELGKEALFRVMDDLFDMGTPLISFSGGEPLLREDIFELISYAAGRAAVHVASNGTLITRETARRLCELGVAGVTVSLDAAEAGVHDRIRGVHGSFVKALEGVRHLSEEAERSRSGLSVDIVAVISGDNAGQIPRLLDVATEMNVAAVGILPIHRFDGPAPGAGGRPGRECADGIQATLDHLIMARKRGGLVDNSVGYLNEVKRYFSGHPRRSPCSAGWTTCVVDCLGNVYPCYGYYVMGASAVGTVEGRGLKGIWFSDDYNRLRSDLFTCKKCVWNCHGEFDVLFRSAMRIRELIGSR